MATKQASTHTRRQKRKPIEKLLADLTMLFTTAVDLINKGKRSETMVTLLLQALQLFKQGRLAAVLPVELGQEILPDNFQALLSLPVKDQPIARRTQTYLTEHGVWYVGELYKLCDRKTHKKLKAIEDVKKLLRHLGLPESLDPIHAGWQPPYWNDPQVLAVLNVAIADKDERDGSFWHRFNVHYLGDIITKRGRGLWHLNKKQQLLSRWAGDTKLHGAMYPPPNWQAPSDLPQALLDYQAKVAAQAEAAQAEQLANIATARTDWLEITATREDRLAFRQTIISVLCANPADYIDSVSVRTTNSLRNLGIEQRHIAFIGQLVQMTRQELLRSKSFGSTKAVNELEEWLLDHGLHLGMSAEEPVIKAFNDLVAAANTMHDTAQQSAK